MVPTIIVGLIFLAIFSYAFHRSRKSLKENKCVGCSGACSIKDREACHR